MPRYQLDDQQLDALLLYLQSLSAQDSAGVDPDRLHFATIVTEDVTPRRRRALLNVLEAFFKDKNAGTRLESRRAENAPWHKTWHYEAFRFWQLHVWTLSGPEADWPEQLRRYYQAQPVFALVSGLSSKSWQPMHRFCEQHELPCLFPSTDLPDITPQGGYSMYFSQGITLEAESLATHLRDTHQPSATRRIFQLHGATPRSRRGAEALRAALRHDAGSRLLHEHRAPGTHFDTGFWRDLLQRHRPTTVVIWDEDVGVADLAALAAAGETIPELYLASHFAFQDLTALPAALRQRTYLVSPYVLPDALPGSLQRVRLWAEMRHIPFDQARLQADAYFAVTMLGMAIRDMRGHLSRDFLLEKLEHMVDSALTSSIYPHVSLAPGQRFVAKGCYIVALADLGAGNDADVRWVVP